MFRSSPRSRTRGNEELSVGGEEGEERMRRQQQRKHYPGRIRSAAGQTTLQSFLFKPRVADGDVRPSPTPEAAEDEEALVSPPEPPKREIVRVTKAIVKEKASAFSSVGSASGKGERGEAGSTGGALGAALFKRFHSSAPAPSAEGGADAGEDGEGNVGGSDVRFDIEDTAAGSGREPWKKRKGPIGTDHEEHGASKARRVVVLGDDPRPRPTRRPGRPRTTRGGGQSEGKRGGALYNHYASGGGWWHGDMEGVDGEEVGWTDDMWEGMGSVTLGGLEWH